MHEKSMICQFSLSLSLHWLLRATVVSDSDGSVCDGCAQLASGVTGDLVLSVREGRVEIEGPVGEGRGLDTATELFPI